MDNGDKVSSFEESYETLSIFTDMSSDKTFLSI